MSNPESWRFVKDIRVVDGNALISSAVDLIFIAANTDLRSGAPRQEEGNSASELLPHEFVEALTRWGCVRVESSLTLSFETAWFQPLKPMT